MHTCHQLPQKGLYAVAGCLPIGEARAPATPRVRPTSFREPWVSPSLHGSQTALQPDPTHTAVWDPQTTAPPDSQEGWDVTIQRCPAPRPTAGARKGRGKTQQKMRIKGLPAQITARKNAPLFLRVGLFFLPLFGLAYSCLQLPLLVA